MQVMWKTAFDFCGLWLIESRDHVKLRCEQAIAFRRDSFGQNGSVELSKLTEEAPFGQFKECFLRPKLYY